VNGVLIGCIYLPNGNPQPGPKFQYKLAWFERLIAHGETLFATDAPVILLGDYNVVPSDFDIYPTKSYAKNALLQPAPRACYRRLLEREDRRTSDTAPGQAHVYVLGLSPRLLAAGCRDAARSPAAE
jgi:exonuclease III